MMPSFLSERNYMRERKGIFLKKEKPRITAREKITFFILTEPLGLTQHSLT